MDTTSFDTLTRSLTTSTTRRTALRGLVASAATLVAGGLLLHEDTAARRRKGKKGKGQKLTAYNMYTIDYMAKHPNQGFPPKGSWAKVPKADVERYQAQADALKAQRA